MYTDLFSSMDGARSYSYWVIPLMFIVSLRGGLLVSNNVSSVMTNLLSTMWYNKETSRFFMLPTMTISLFVFLVYNNLLGLTPMSYTLTSDLFTVSGMGLLMWLLLLASGYSKAPKASLAHLAPSGAPLGLLPFLVLVESISILIRPLTLTVRLIANISAGHIVLGLLANVTSSLIHSMTLPVCLLVSVSYTLFEFFVGMIQAYIFTLLVTLYSAEHP